MSDDERLVRLAAEIADGARIAWSDEQAATDSDEERELLRELEVLERLADLHCSPADRSAEISSSDRGATLLTLSPGDDWGPLRILDRIGSGTFGTVYRAFDPRLDREVALKVLHPRGLHHGSVETLPDSMVVDEGRLLARVRHAGVVTVHGAEQVNGRVGIWMELVRGRTLSAELTDRGPLPAREVQQIGVHLADALAAAHAAGVLHRDIKAQNVMRESSGRTVLMDFGTGLDLGQEGSDLAGTPLYLAPELLEGGAATQQSDVYALGVLLFHLLTGTFPYRGRTIREVRRAHSRKERHLLRDIARTTPRALAAVIERATAVDPAARFQSASSLLDALRTAGPEARQRRLLVMAGAAVLVASAALSIAALRSRDGSTRTDVVPAPAGIVEEQIDPDLQRRVAIRGPAVGNWIPCHPRGSNGAIAVCNLSTGTIRVLRPARVPAGPYPSGRQHLSPDGQHLAYLWGGGPEARGIGTVRVISLDGTDDRELYRVPGTIDIQKWTPDSERIVIRVGMGSPDHRVLLVRHATGDVQELLRLDPSVILTDLSPDGQTLLVTRLVNEQHDISVIDLASAAEVWRLDEPSDDSYALYTPDGRGIVFISDRNGCKGAMFVATPERLPEGAPVTLKDFGRNHVIPMGFSADGSLLVTLLHASRTTFRTTVDLERGSIPAGRPLSFRCTEDSSGPDWDPSGERVAFMSGRFRQPFPARVIVQSRDGRVLREWPAPGVLSWDSRLRWAPDGHRLAVIAGDVKMNAHLYLLDPVTGDAREIVPGAGEGVKDVRWDPSGGALYYRTQRTIGHLPLDGASAQIVYTVPEGHAFGAASGFDVSPRDGALVLSTSPEGSNECWLRLVDRDGTDRVGHRFAGDCQAVAWTRDGGRLLVATLPGPRAALWLLERSGGDPTKLSLDTEGVWELSLSPDGRELLYSTGNPRPNMVVLRGLSGAASERP
jgi:serine/threonine-protein kinase